MLSLYEFSTFADLKSYFVCSDFVLLWAIPIACFCWLCRLSELIDKYYPKLS